MKRYTILLVVFAALLAIVLAAGEAKAGPPAGPEHMTATECSQEIAVKQWKAGDTVHGREGHSWGYIQAEGSELFEPYETTWNYNINMATGGALLWGTIDHQTADGTGGWNAKFTGTMYLADPMVLYLVPDTTDQFLPLWLSNLKGVSHGYGALTGAKARWEETQWVTVYADDSEAYASGAPCISGYALNADGTGVVPYVLRGLLTRYTLGMQE